jgi:hypothetical protein
VCATGNLVNFHEAFPLLPEFSILIFTFLFYNLAPSSPTHFFLPNSQEGPKQGEKDRLARRGYNSIAAPPPVTVSLAPPSLSHLSFAFPHFLRLGYPTSPSPPPSHSRPCPRVDLFSKRSIEPPAFWYTCCVRLPPPFLRNSAPPGPIEAASSTTATLTSALHTCTRYICCA